MILVLLVLMKIFPEALSVECLQCYQCSSTTDDPNPYCDTDYWYTLTDAKKKSYAVGCPEHAREFCVKKTVFLSGGKRQTERGCIGSHDGSGVEFREGCITTEGEKDMKVCFCTEKLCNSARSNAATDEWLLIFLLSCSVLSIRSLS